MFSVLYFNLPYLILHTNPSLLIVLIFEYRLLLNRRLSYLIKQ